MTSALVFSVNGIPGAQGSKRHVGQVKQGKPDDVSRSWPVQPPPAGWDPQQLPEPRQEDAA